MAADVEDFDGLMNPELEWAEERQQTQEFLVFWGVIGLLFGSTLALLLWAIQGVQTWAIRMSQ